MGETSSVMDPGAEELKHCSRTLEEFKTWIFWADQFIMVDPAAVMKAYNEMADNDKWMLCTLVPIGSLLDCLLWDDYEFYEEQEI